MAGMRRALASMLLAGCLGESEAESCRWQERLTHANAPPDECARYTPAPGYEDRTRFRPEGDTTCAAVVACIVVQPGERADILGAGEAPSDGNDLTAEAHAAVEYGPCAELQPCP
jgi:hypothetical protein